MTTQFRDTPCGHLIRVLTGNKILRYADEVDPKGYHAALTARTVEKGPSPDREEVTQRKFEGGKDDVVVVVDWYSPDDPEVRLTSNALPDGRA